MANRSGYRGVGLQLVDDKGRVAVPAPLRAALEKNTGAEKGSKDGRQFLIAIHETEPCLVAYDLEYGDLLQTRLETRETEYVGELGAADPNIMRMGAGAGEEVQYDTSGRFILPAFPRSHAGIAKHAFFYGALKQFEIWDPARLLSHPGAPEIMKSACRFHLEDRGIAL